MLSFSKVFFDFASSCRRRHPSFTRRRHKEARHVTETMYCLEILRKIEDVDEMRARNGAYEHVGYEHRVDPSTARREILRFSTKKKAAEYYDAHKREMGHGYPDDFKMRLLNAHNTWRSDWHPVTKLAYAVREDHGVVAYPSVDTHVDSTVSDRASEAFNFRTGESHCDSHAVDMLM